MTNAMFQIYGNKIKKFYEIGFSKQEVKQELSKEMNYYEQALYEVRAKQNKVQSFTSFEDLYNYDEFGYKHEFKTYQEFMKHLQACNSSFNNLLEEHLENLDYRVCHLYTNKNTTMCTRWEIENRIECLEKHLMSI